MLSHRQATAITSGETPGWVSWVQAVERLRSATELLGEKDERMAELAADVADMRQLYREQVEVFVEQLGRASQQNTPQPSPRPQTSVAEPEGALDDLQ